MARNSTPGAQAQEDTINQAAGTSAANAQNLYGTASAGYNSIVSNPGYTPAQINSQTIAATTPYSVGSAQAQNALQRRAATSGNAAGMVAGQDSIARTAAQGESQAQLGVANKAADTALSERDKALSGLSNLYGDTLKGASELYGNANQALAQRRGTPLDVKVGPVSVGGI